jgi:hypothetical protein
MQLWLKNRQPCRYQFGLQPIFGADFPRLQTQELSINQLLSLGFFGNHPLRKPEAGQNGLTQRQEPAADRFQHVNPSCLRSSEFGAEKQKFTRLTSTFLYRL